MKNSSKVLLLLLGQYANIGGQAVIEGVMMRSPNAFVVAVRKPDGGIRLRSDQWPIFFKKRTFLKKPFLRGILFILETVVSGIVSLNYSANIAMKEELKEKSDSKAFLTIASSLLLGLALFVVVPHLVTAGIAKIFSLNWDLNGLSFHLTDGAIKAMLFIFYIWAIGHIPDIKRIFQYHGAEHKSIAAFEANEKLEVLQSQKFSILHPHCGTSFLFFVLFVSIIVFSGLFALIPIGNNLAPILKHITAVVVKILFLLPVAGLSYEIVKFAGKHSENFFCKILNFCGLQLQKLTTKEPDSEQLEVALASMKAVLELEEKHNNLKDRKEEKITMSEIDINTLSDIKDTNQDLRNFLEQ